MMTCRCCAALEARRRLLAAPPFSFFAFHAIKMLLLVFTILILYIFHFMRERLFIAMLRWLPPGALLPASHAPQLTQSTEENNASSSSLSGHCTHTGIPHRSLLGGIMNCRIIPSRTAYILPLHNHCQLSDHSRKRKRKQKRQRNNTGLLHRAPQNTHHSLHCWVAGSSSGIHTPGSRQA